MYRPVPPFQYPYPPAYGLLGELPAGITQGACDLASNQGAKDALGLVDPKAGFQALVTAAPPATDELAAAMMTCYMAGYDAEKAKQGSFYQTTQGKTGLVVGGIAGLVLGIVVGKVLL